jgi:hypothetical protein
LRFLCIVPKLKYESLLQVKIGRGATVRDRSGRPQVHDGHESTHIGLELKCAFPIHISNPRSGFCRRYEKAKKPLSAFEADIQKYKDLTDEIAGEDSSATMRFLRVECGPLKQGMTLHCEQWVARFT